MFDKLEDLVRRYEEITNELTEPSVVNDQKRFRTLMKEQSDLQPLVDTYTEYKKCRETESDSLAMLEEESEEEMREMLKEELSDAKKRMADLEQKLKILLLPKDPNDDKNVIVEIRAGAKRPKRLFHKDFRILPGDQYIFIYRKGEPHKFLAAGQILQRDMGASLPDQGPV